jgi:transcriptional regulator with GAF, ATPase, and Fis domain
VDVRVIAATSQDLEKAIQEGHFRQDLFYRLNVFPINVPPLRQRREDIPLLVWSFVDQMKRAMGKSIDTIDASDMDALLKYAWPGNIRELRNLVERALITAKGPKLRIMLPEITPTDSLPSHALQDIERDHIHQVLVRTRWRIRGAKGAAEILGMKPSTLESRMAKLGIRRPI